MSPTALKATGEYEKGNYAAALKMLDAGAAGSGPEAEQMTEATKLRHSLETRTKAKFARLDWYVENGDYEKADAPADPAEGDVRATRSSRRRSRGCGATSSPPRSWRQEREASKALAKVQKLIQGDRGSATSR
jgi:hypothetical protein